MWTGKQGWWVYHEKENEADAKKKQKAETRDREHSSTNHCILSLGTMKHPKPNCLFCFEEIEGGREGEGGEGTRTELLPKLFFLLLVPSELTV